MNEVIAHVIQQIYIGEKDVKEVLRPTVIACDIDDEMTEPENSMLFTRKRIRIRERDSDNVISKA